MRTEQAYVQASRLLNETAPVDVPDVVEAMTREERDTVGKRLEMVAERAAFLATYLRERGGFGYGDRGHKGAVKKANAASRVVWMKVFHYRAHSGLRI